MKLDNRGSVIVEFSLIFPIIFIIIITLLTSAIHLYSHIQLQTIAQEKANEYAKQISHPEIESNEINTAVNDPYRYIFPKGDVKDGDMTIEVEGFLIYHRVSVEIEKTQRYPIDLSILGLPNEYKMKAKAEATVNDPDEFIRNIDLMNNISSNNLNFSFGDLGGKLNSFIDKVTGKGGE